MTAERLDDTEELRQLASKREITPLAAEIRARLMDSVRQFAPEFSNAGMTVKITHETWSNPATREYAAQIASVLRESGVEVKGPEQITYFLVTPSSPDRVGIQQSGCRAHREAVRGSGPVDGADGEMDEGGAKGSRLGPAPLRRRRGIRI